MERASLRMGQKSKWELTPGAAPMASSTAALKAASCSEVALVRSSLGGGEHAVDEQGGF